jgi:hypothetical protein
LAEAHPEADDMNALTKEKTPASADARVDARDWNAVAADLDASGCAVIPELLQPDECAAISQLYNADRNFRSHVHMARHGFGRGEYKYFKYPLPDLIGELRTALYPRLAVIANGWNERMGLAARYPVVHADYLQQCHERGRCGRRPCCCNTG